MLHAEGKLQPALEVRVSSILRFQLLNVLVLGLLTACGGDDDSPVFNNNDAGSTGGTSGTGGSGGTSGGGSGGTSGGCAELNCPAPATCDATTAPKCVCPAGYEDVGGDGRNCRDIDECTAGTDDCHAGATCTNTPGSFTCACNAPAWTGDGKSCACATGYSLVGEQCLKDNAGPCTTGTECASGNCVGGACCEEACDSPGLCEKLEGTVCVNGNECRYGKIADNTVCDDSDACTNTSCFDGECTVDPQDPGTVCTDNNACTTDSCEPGTGTCVFTPFDVATECNDNNPCTRDTCSRAAGCQHTDNDAAACTDGNPCTDDQCQGGTCIGTPKACPSTDCTTGSCNNGSCVATPTNANGACDDGLNVCSATGKCNAAGACVDQSDACGPLAASCAPCSSGAGCFSGRLCTCKPPAAGAPPNILVDGVCVPNTNECAANPCDPLATACNDPTPDGSVTGDVRCTCPAGYNGTGVTATGGCVDINECAAPTNPCGNGTCTNRNPPLRYSCACPAGFRSINTSTGPTCTCDLSGTYALVVDATFTFPPINSGGSQAIEGSPPGGVSARSWSIRYHTVAANGTVTARTIPCGGTAPTVCDTALGVAHAQYQPNQIWGRPKTYNPPAVQTITSTLSASVRPGGSYNEPEVVSVFGLTLDNPSGAWPPCRQCVGVPVGGMCTCPGASAPYRVTNRATWVDTDEDSSLGITTEDVSRGGELINDNYPDPPIAYTEPSECPRIATPHNTYNYMEWPGLADGLLFRTYRWYGATRGISSMRGSTITFDGAANQCVIAGTLAGPDAGRPRADARIQGCETCNPVNFLECLASNPCNAAQVDSYDTVEQTQQVTSTNFTLRKIPQTDVGAVLALPEGPSKVAQLNQLCAEVREANCIPGEDCNVP
jgi:hypothetical protein